MRYMLFTVVAVAGFSMIDSACAATWTIAPPGTQRSKEIKSMDIMERPNRPLHVYGDVVRLANRRR